MNILPFEDAFRAVLHKYKGIAIKRTEQDRGQSPFLRVPVVPDSPYRCHFREGRIGLRSLLSAFRTLAPVWLDMNVKILFAVVVAQFLTSFDCSL